MTASRTLFRICAPVIILCGIVLIVGGVLEFSDKNRFDANSYPVSDFLLFEAVCATVVVVIGWAWILTLRRR